MHVHVRQTLQQCDCTAVADNKVHSYRTLGSDFTCVHVRRIVHEGETERESESTPAVEKKGAKKKIDGTSRSVQECLSAAQPSVSPLLGRSIVVLLFTSLNLLTPGTAADTHPHTESRGDLTPLTLITEKSVSLLEEADTSSSPRSIPPLSPPWELRAPLVFYGCFSS